MDNEIFKKDNLSIICYSDFYEKLWDDFVLNESINGTILQTRKFLNYHHSGKYEDSSLLFYYKDYLIAVCPAATVRSNAEKAFVSHPGSTYGGILLSSKALRAQKIFMITDSIEDYLRVNCYGRIVLKQTNPLMCRDRQDLLEFCLFYRGFKEYKELDLYVDYDDYNEDILSNFSKLKKRNVNKCLRYGLEIKKLSSSEEYEKFISILAGNLSKYGLKPYHTAADLENIVSRFPSEVELWGAFLENKMVACSMVFLFLQSNCAHTHYLAADLDYNDISPMSYIYYSMIEIYKKRGCKYLSWGITTEHNGVEINKNLTNTKEEFGSKHNVVSVFEKQLV